MVVADAHDTRAEELELLATRCRRQARRRPRDRHPHVGNAHFRRPMVVASSMADGVVAHLASRAFPGVKVLSSTPACTSPRRSVRETRSLRPRHRAASTPARPHGRAADQKFGPNLWATDPDRCCQMRKVRARLANLHRSWHGRPASAATRRLHGSAHPSCIGTARRAMVKVNPIARWSHEEVEAYAARHGVLINPLQQLASHRSVAHRAPVRCSPVRTARAGRWAGADKSECGIHV